MPETSSQDPLSSALRELEQDPSSLEAVEAGLVAVRAGNPSSAAASELLRLARQKADACYCFLLCEALHCESRFVDAHRILVESRRDPSRRADFDALSRHFQPRVQERLRFYSAARTLGFEERDVLEVGGRLRRDFVDAAGVASWTSLDPRVEEDVDEPGYRLIRGDAAAMPLPDESIDLVFSSSAFEHIQDLGGSLSEMARVLRPGGLVFSDFSPIWSSADGHHLRSRARAALKKTGLWPLPEWSHLTMTRKEMRAHLSAKLEGAELRTVERWLYRRDTINRLFYEDYIHFFHASPLRVQTLDCKPGPEPDADTLSLLARRHPGRGNFHVRGFRVVLRK